MTPSTTNAMTIVKETSVKAMETADPRGRGLRRYGLMGSEAR